MPKSPVFIVGSPRSGTSILVDAMVSGGYHGFREGNLLTLLAPFGRLIDRHFKSFAGQSDKVLVTAVDPNEIRSKIAQIFQDITNRLNPKAPWFDKTGNPEMIDSIPTLRELWPDCVFIFAKRRAIENLVSRVKKFPAFTFEYHCQDWG